MHLEVSLWLDSALAGGGHRAAPIPLWIGASFGSGNPLFGGFPCDGVGDSQSYSPEIMEVQNGPGKPSMTMFHVQAGGVPLPCLFQGV